MFPSFFQDNNGATPKVSTFLCFLFTVVLPKSHSVHVGYPTNKQTCHWSDDIDPTGDWPSIQLKRNLVIECASITKKEKGNALSSKCRGQMREIPICIIPIKTPEKKPSKRMLVGLAKMEVKAAFVPF